MTVPEFAAECRKSCTQPAQGYDEFVPCGRETFTDEGEARYSFCGRHMAAVNGATQ